VVGHEHIDRGGEVDASEQPISKDVGFVRVSVPRITNDVFPSNTQ